MVRRDSSPYSRHEDTPRRRDDDAEPVPGQAVDYARLRLAARPFQLFGFYRLVYGDYVCVARFDRYDILISKKFPMFNFTYAEYDRETEGYILDSRRGTAHISLEFIHVAVQFMVSQTNADFCTEPGIAPFHSLERRTRFSVPVGKQILTTLDDAPFWASDAPFGRGTSVSRVVTPHSSEPAIMKTSWKFATSRSEKDTYNMVCAALSDRRGIADILAADYVYDGAMISIPPHVNLILHRVVYTSGGGLKPLWEFRSEMEFLRGFRAIIDTLKRLHDVGIVHRDISPGCLHLSASQNPAEGMEGFVSDFEFALVPDICKIESIRVLYRMAIDDMEELYRNHSASQRNADESHELDKLTEWGPVQPLFHIDENAPLTGTAHFFAEEVLQAIRPSAYDSDPPKSMKFPQWTTIHDLISAIRVATYALVHQSIAEADLKGSEHDKAMLSEVYIEQFGQVTYRAIQDAHILSLGRPHVWRCLQGYYPVVTRLVMSMSRLVTAHRERLEIIRPPSPDGDMDFVLLGEVGRRPPFRYLRAQPIHA
ncbi:hypothetical protein K474DRAFT_1713960 [Panus rudis PR-1116 ss-1]|nr:hypothetical protein K474DRAFT_1713960 [Panus rudis PR-1116 ss-1]